MPARTLKGVPSLLASWDLPAAHDEASSMLPNRVEAYPFFELHNGLILGPNNRAIAAYPQRLLVQDLTREGYPALAEIPANHNERDPLLVWLSQWGERIYMDVNQSDLRNMIASLQCAWFLP